MPGLQWLQVLRQRPTILYGVVFGLVLLAVEEAGKAAPLVLASVVAALILGGASFAAYRK